MVGGLSYGDNSNVIGIGDGIALPADISDESSDFVRAEIGAAWLLRPTDKDLFNFSYTAQLDHYFDLHQFDQQVHTLAVDYSRLLLPKLIGTLRGSADIAFVDDEHYLSRPGAGRCHPLTVLDDHSRYALRLEACANQQAVTVQGKLNRPGIAGGHLV